MIEADVVVNGAGLAGTFVAWLLGRAGLRIAVVDKDRVPPARGGEILKPGAVRILAACGVLPALIGRGALRGHVIRYYHDGQLSHHYDFRQHTELGYFLVAHYRDIVAALVEQCGPLPNVTFLFGSPICSLRWNGGTIRSAVLNDGREISASAFVNASPGSGVLCSAVDATLVKSEYGHAIWAGEIPLAAPLEDNRLYFSSEGRFCYFYPLPGGVRVFVGLPVGEDISGNIVSRLAAFVTESAGPLDALVGTQLRQMPFGAARTNPYHVGNVVSLGTAAWACHPMTGQGMSLTLEDSIIVAGCILDARGDSGALAELMTRRYETRRAAHEKIIAYGDVLARSYHDEKRYRKFFDPVLHGDMGAGDPTSLLAAAFQGFLL